MLLRRISGEQICLCCQLRLLKQAARLNNLPVNHALQSRCFRLQRKEAWLDTIGSSKSISSSAEGPIEAAKSEEKIRKPSHRENVRRDIIYKRLPLSNDQLTKHPLGRLHGFRGRKVREQAVGLGVDTLGTEAKVIVLRDAGIHYSPRPEIEELKGGEAVDILARLDAERGLIGRAEVEKNIEELKPKDFQKSTTWNELQVIEQQLVNGFTVSQLAGYIRSFEVRQKAKVLSDVEETQNKRLGPVIEESKWMSGISENGEEFEESILRGYRSDAFTPKQRLVLQLLRQCWHIEVREVIESIGEVELKMGNAELELLLKGHSPVLRLISDKLIANREEKIEVFRARHVIRITAPKEKSSIIVQEIRNALQDTRHLEIDLNVLLHRQGDTKTKGTKTVNEIYGNFIIDELSRLTETHILRLSLDQLAVSCINRKPESSLSTGADVARRLLLTSSDLSSCNVSQIGCDESPESLVSVKYHATGNMHWRDRLRNWVRFVSAIPLPLPHDKEAMSTNHLATDPGKTMDDTEKPSPIQTTAVTSPVSVDMSQSEINKAEFENAMHKTREYISWKRTTCTTTSATVGHILHEFSEASDAAALSSSVLTTGHVIFRPDTLHLSRFLGTLEPPTAPPKASLVMRFLPSPWTVAGSRALTEFPPVEMNFAIHPETKDLQLKDVIAVVTSTASDVMLPVLPLDLRFQQRSTAQLQMPCNYQLPQITNFLEASQLNITRGRLETPPNLNLPIARHLCSKVAQVTPSSPLDDNVNVEYLFAGLEYRNTLSLNFEGWSLVYTSVESGKADGRRGELSLLPHRLKSNTLATPLNSAELQVNQTQDFIQAAYSLAETLGSFDSTQIRRQKVFAQVRRTFTEKGPHIGHFKYFDQKINFTKEATGEN